MNDFRAESRRRRLSDAVFCRTGIGEGVFLFLAAGRTCGQMILRHGRLGAQQVINTVQIGLFLQSRQLKGIHGVNGIQHVQDGRGGLKELLEAAVPAVLRQNGRVQWQSARGGIRAVRGVAKVLEQRYNARNRGMAASGKVFGFVDVVVFARGPCCCCCRNFRSSLLLPRPRLFGGWTRGHGSCRGSLPDVSHNVICCGLRREGVTGR